MIFPLKVQYIFSGTLKLRTIAILFFLSCTLLHVYAQNKYTISGYVKDAQTGEYLIGANVYIKELLKGTVTNQYGFFSVTIEQGKYSVVSSFIGFKNYSVAVDLKKDTRLNISLETHSITTNEVVITGEKAEVNVQEAQMGRIGMDVEKIKALPAFLGEVDILKTIQLLPGVQSAGEGNSGFYVRGGGPDQNLILLDEAVVYNPSHLFGFFSVFNSDAVKNVELIKGGMPANYGGRLASVLDISMKEGNSKKFKADGGIGLISSRLTVQGPIKKDTSSFIISGRRTYIDVLLAPFVPNDSRFKGSGYYFYDLNTKFNYRISDRDRIFLSGYFGRDIFKFYRGGNSFNATIPWGNATASMRWNHLFNNKLFMNTTVIFSDYDFAFEASQNDFSFKLFSGIRDWNAKVDFNLLPSILHSIKFGANVTHHTFTPSSVSAKAKDVTFDTGEITRQPAIESAVYINDEFDITEKLKFNCGLRASAFTQIGPFTRFVKDDITNRVVDSIKYQPFQEVKTWYGLEPRYTVRYAFSSRSSLKFAYTHNYQYIHLASLSPISLPTDVWVPSSDKVKPQIGTQYAGGYFRNFYNNNYETSIEGYYKDMQNLVEYKEGFAPGDNLKDNTDNNLTFGKGWSYGVELFLKKRLGRLNGWIGYTWSKTMRQFDDINQGREFPAKFDRRHDLAIVGIYELSERLTLSSTFVFATGNTATLPVKRYFFEGNIVNVYGDRNSYRLPPYHRMDIAVTLKGKENKRFKSSWNFAVYNLYSRANPYFIYFDNTGKLEQGTLSVKAYQVSLFPILPSVTWNFSF